MEQPTPDQSSGSMTNSYTYLLRIWRTDVDQPWRITLRRAGLSQAQHFPSLMTLIAALWQQLKRADGSAPAEHK